MMRLARQCMLFGLGDVLDGQHAGIFDPGLEVVGIRMPGVWHIEFFGIVPGIAPEEHVADRIRLDGRPEHCSEPVFDWRLL